MDLILAQLPLAKITTDATLPEAPDRLRESMAEHGQVDPVHARPRDDDRYTLTAGEPVLAVARALRWETLVAIVETAEGAALPQAERALILDEQRRSLTLLHRARKARDLVDQERYTQARVAKLLRVKAPMLSRILKVMRCPDLETAVDREALPFSAAMELAALKEAPRRAYLAELRETKIALKHFPTVMQIRRGVQERQGKPGLPPLTPDLLLPFMTDLLSHDSPLDLEVATTRRTTPSIRILLPEAEHDATVALIERLRSRTGCPVPAPSASRDGHSASPAGLAPHPMDL